MNQWGARTHGLHRERECECAHCGETFVGRAAHAKYCPACKVLIKQERAEELIAARAAQVHVRNAQFHWNCLPFEVVADPLPLEDGGLKPGARFTEQAVVLSLKLSSFTAGTVLRRRDIRRFKVKGSMSK